MTLWLLAACTGDLIPGERVLGDEVPAIVIEGQAGSGFGASVAIGEDEDGAIRVVVGAPDLGQVAVFDLSGETVWSVTGQRGLGTEVGWLEGTAWAWAPGSDVVFDIQANADAAHSASDATSIGVCPDGQVLSRTGKGEDVACDEAGLLATSCEERDCEVERTESEIDGAGTSAGSAVGFWGSVACFGDARIESEESPGEVHCEDGTQVAGEPGDHLGLAIAGGRIAGVFNRHLQPPRARIPSLDGEVTWAVDRAAERSRIALSGARGHIAVGVPGFGATKAREGRVFLVEVSQ